MTEFLKSDEQTLNDLAIFNTSGKPSVFDLFHKTVTQGGGAQLKKLFRHPISNAKLINKRASVYQFFSKGEYKFPVDSETMEVLISYLENKDVRSQISTDNQSLGRRLKDFLATDYSQIFIQDGVRATLRFFLNVAEFIKNMEPVVTGTAYEPSFVELVSLIDDPEFVFVRLYANRRTDAKLNTPAMADLDKRIRFDLKEKLVQILNLVYDLDVYIAVGQVARNRRFCFAKALPKEESTFCLKHAYHPHVNDAIPNDLSLNGVHNILFLTGANMAGKSTLMKSIGVALYLGHMGFPVAAEVFEFSVRDGIYTSINLADSLISGASHYYTEVLRVKEIAQELRQGKQLFVIFDELFRGTNVRDANDATIALTRAFCSKKGSQFIISTHIIEAGEYLKKENLPVKFQYLPTVMEGNTPIYSRVLKNGITSDRQGMIIIQNEGILELLDAGIKKMGSEKCHL